MKTIRRPRLSAASVAPCSVSIASQSGVSRADSAIKPVLLLVVPMQAENGEGGSALEEDGGGTDGRTRELFWLRREETKGSGRKGLEILILGIAASYSNVGQLLV